MNECPCPSRRRLLTTLALAPFLITGPRALARMSARSLSFYHTHTGAWLSATYFDGSYLPQSLAQIEAFLRDFRTGESHPIDLALLDMLHVLTERFGRSTFEVISGYRSPTTNAALAKNSTGVSKSSLHMEGRAIDVRLTGVDTARLRQAAIELRCGGVGYYPESDFVHLDTGRPRAWGAGPD